ncbi:MAG: glycogen debranching protein GlgX [Cytophagales bacterium]|nr:glycogen debranching protein GlgX [Cytophagales bacterium]
MNNPDYKHSVGEPHPLGATLYKYGKNKCAVNFSLFSNEAQSVDLLLFDKPEDALPSHVIPFDPKENKTYYYWHIFVEGLSHGQLYAFRVNGVYQPENGYRYDSEKALIDPYAKAIVQGNFDREEAKKLGNNIGTSMKSVIIDSAKYDWEGDKHPKIPYESTIFYEMHVKGFTQDPSSGVAPHKRGTYTGVIEKIPYLKELGITAVELMPVFQFDYQDAPLGRPNYWGYSPINFFAPHNAYASDPNNADAIVDEFRDMIKAFHKAGIEVILDVVFNHTAEGNELGPIYNFKGFSNESYYLLDPEDRGKYLNYTGCGNSVNANHSIVRRMIIDSLIYWVKEMHVDGFRFDLASVLSRDEDGNPMKNPPILWEIESEPALAGTKIIAEAWDAAGLYQVGTFIGDRWAEWNGKFRDDVRRFMRGDNQTVQALAARIFGSPDVFQKEKRNTDRSIHFVTCHDGFTLWDLVSYNEKHNLLNRENNQDGMDENFSWNCGTEGETDDKEINQLRIRQVKNFMVLTLFAQGTPLLLMGDEFGRTQKGNNNAYSQDNEISWMDWTLEKKNSELLKFTRCVIQLSQKLKIMQIDYWLLDQKSDHKPYILWHGTQLNQADWGEHSHCLAFELCHPQQKEHLYIAINAYWEDMKFELPEGTWKMVVDTAGKDAIQKKANAPHVMVKNRSIKIFINHAADKKKSKQSIRKK